ncbi:TRAP transporter substrate-binding protein [Serratia liquefaciens]|uniref:TRAP transporter substrate-binding protein n=1 Tax=Serratia liquefaciens TaxID=614 RepID=UPI002FEFA2BB
MKSMTCRLTPRLFITLLFMLFTLPLRANAAEVNLRVYSSLPDDGYSAHAIWFNRFKQNLEQRLPGKIALNYFPNGMLGKEADAVQQVRIGAIDMMISGTSIWATLVPEIGVLDLGYLFNDNQQLGRTLDGQAGQLLSAMLAKQSNIKVLGYGFSLGARNIYSKKPLQSPQDLNRMKVRVLPAPNFIATLKSMGATAIPMPGGEVYSALQMGVIDGVEHDAATVYTSKYYEIAKNATLTRHIYNPIVATISQAAFQRIPQNLRDEVLAAANEATLYERKIAAEKEIQAMEKLKAAGVIFSETDRGYFRQQTLPLQAAFTAKYPQAKAVLDAIHAAAQP